MHRVFEVVLQPSPQQQGALVRLLTGQRALYNAALEERRGAWAWERRAVSRRDQYAQLTGWDDPLIGEFGVTAARGTLLRLDRAFQGFFQRVKAGGAPGFPRFKAAGRFDSIEYPQRHSWKVHEDTGRLYVQGVGHVKFRAAAQPNPSIPTRSSATSSPSTQEYCCDH